MAYTNTWQIVSPVSSDDWGPVAVGEIGMNGQLTALKTDIVERIWEDGLHLENATALPSLSSVQVLLSTVNAAGQTLLVKNGSNHPLSLVDSGKIYPGIIGSFPDVIPFCGGFIDSDGVMRAATCEVVTVTSDGTSYVTTTLDGDITDLRSDHLGFTCFWDDGAAYICKRFSGSLSAYKYLSVDNVTGDDVLSFFTNSSVIRDYTISARAII